MFEKVTYKQYNEVLERAVIPSEDVFNSFKLEAVLFVKKIVCFLTEREEDGIDNATCLICEELYKASKNKTENGEKIASFSLDGYSQSLDVSGASDIREKCFKWINLYCYVDSGVI